MLVCHLYIFLEEISIQVLCLFLIGLFVFLLLNFKCSLHSLDPKNLSDRWFANTFSHSVGCLFTFLIMSFTAMFLNFDKAQYHYFNYILYNILCNILTFMMVWSKYPKILLFLMLFMTYIRICCQVQVHNDLSLCFLLLKVLWF